MDIERIVIRLMGDASQYTRTMDEVRDRMNRLGTEIGNSSSWNAASARIQQMVAKFSAQNRQLESKQLVDRQNMLQKQLAIETEFFRRRDAASMEFTRRMRVSNASPASKRESSRRFDIQMNENEIRRQQRVAAANDQFTASQKAARDNQSVAQREALAVTLSKLLNPKSAANSGPGHGGMAGGAISGVARAASSFSMWDSAIQGVSKSLSIMGTIVGTVVAGGIVGAGIMALKLAVDYERATIAFEVMTKSAVTGAQLLKDIQNLAIESPFQTSELAQSAKQVLAFGFEVQDVIPVLSRLGDVSTATGADMDRLILALGQVRTTGRLMGQELRQFTNAGVPILEYLAKVLGTTTQAVPNLVRQGKISFSDVASAINMMTDEGGLFYGMMQRINKETVSGRWANFKETVQLTGMAFGQAFFEIFRVKELLTDLSDTLRGMNLDQTKELLTGVRLGFYALWQGIKSVVGGIVGFISRNQALVASVAAAIVIVGLFIAAWFLFATPMGQAVLLIGLAIAAIAGLIYGLSELGMFDGMGDRLADGFGKMVPIFQEAWKGITDAIKGNDMALAIDILMVTMRAAWRKGLALMHFELVSFGMKGGEIAIEIEYNAMNALKKWNKYGLTTQVERDAWRNREIAALSKNRENQRANIMNSSDQELATALSAIRDKAEGAHIGAMAEEQFTSQTGKNIEGYLRRGNYEATHRQNLQYTMPVYPSGSVVPDGNALSSVMGTGAVEATYRKLWTDAAARIQDFQFMSRKGLNAEELKPYSEAVNVSVSELDLFRNAIEGVGKTAKKLSEHLEISPEALHAALEINKAFDHGTSAMSAFRNQMSLIREASEGPLKFHHGNIVNGSGLAGVIGGMAGIGNFGSNLGVDKEAFGKAKAFMNLQKEIGTGRANFAPAMMQGSREAAETIIRSNSQQLTVEQQVLETLRMGNALAKENAIYQKKVADFLTSNKEASGLIEKLTVNKPAS